MRTRLLLLPYDSGQRALRMGRGPAHLAENGIADRLRAHGHEVDVEIIETAEPFPSEIKVTFDLHRRLAERVRASIVSRAFPIVLSGNCNAAVGAMAGIDPLHTGLVWFDAHGEFNTPETTQGGFLDGMGLAIATGRCWRGMASRIPGFRPVPDDNIVLIGGRDFDPPEMRELQRTGITLIPPSLIHEWGVSGAVTPTLASLHDRVTDVYVHIDLDVLDRDEATPNMWATGGGLRVAEVEETLQLVRERFTLRGVGIGSYDPEADVNQRGLRAALRFVDAVCDSSSRSAAR
jgi:arginase